MELWGYFVIRNGQDDEVRFEGLTDALNFIHEKVNAYKYKDDESFGLSNVIYAIFAYDDPEEDGYAESVTYFIVKRNSKGVAMAEVIWEP